MSDNKPTRLEEIELEHDFVVTGINGYIDAGWDVYISMAPMRVSFLVATAIDTDSGVRVQFVDPDIPALPVLPGGRVTVHVLQD